MLQYAGNQTWIKSIQRNSSIGFGLPPILQHYQTECYSTPGTRLEFNQSKGTVQSGLDYLPYYNIIRLNVTVRREPGLN